MKNLVNRATLLAACLLLVLSLFVSGCGSDPVAPITHGPHRDFDNPDTNTIKKDTNYYRDRSTKFFKLLGLDVDLSQVKIPAHPKGYDVLIFMPHIFSYSILREKQRDVYGKKYFSGNNYEWIWNIKPNLEQRTTDVAYAFWCRDPELENFDYYNVVADSAIKRDERLGTKTMTALEYGVLSLSAYLMDGVIVDAQGSTMCTGSRGGGGGIPTFSHGSQGFTIGFSSSAFLGGDDLPRIVFL